MHEFGITSRMVEAVLRVAEANEASRVIRVDLVIGQLTFLSTQQVKLAYDILTKGTLLEGSQLSIEESEGLVQCQDCRRQNKVAINMAFLTEGSSNLSSLSSCPECGGKTVVMKGKEYQMTGVCIC